MMAPSCSTLTLFVGVAVLCQYTYGLPGGAPSSTCQSMTPGHGTQQTTDVYTLDIGSVDDYQPGTSVQVTVTGAAYQGLLIQARNKHGAITGSFSGPASGSGLQLLACDGSPGSAVTHSDTTSKTDSVLMWNPPQEYDGEIYFVATIASAKATWWKDVRSDTFGSGDPSSPSRAPTVTGGHTLCATVAVIVNVAFVSRALLY